MKIARSSAIAAMFSIGAVLIGPRASAQQIPALEEVPGALPLLRSDSLAQRHTAIASTRDSLRSRIKQHDDNCHIYDSSSAAGQQCPAAKVRLQADKEAYIASVKSFNWDLEQAIGDYRNSLVGKLRDLDAGLGRDVAAIQALGFKRRAEDFDDLARLSTEAHGLAFVKIMDVLIGEGMPLVAEGIVTKLRGLRATGLGPGEAKALLKQFDDGNLVNPKARAYLREVALGSTPGMEAKLAGAIHEDLQQIREITAAGGGGESKEAALRLLQWIGPPGSGIMEIAVWVGYDVTAQALVSGSVETLAKATEGQLKGLNSIMCLSQKRLVEKHEVGSKLAAIEGEPFERQKPIVNHRCGDKPAL